MKRFTITLTEEKYELLCEMAERNTRCVSSEAAWIIEKQIEREYPGSRNVLQFKLIKG